MAPSVALDRQQSSTMGGVAEQAILRDYLIECSRTPPNPFQSPQATKEEWWDTGNQNNYKAILLERHLPGIDQGRLRSLKKLKVPDISTWNGRYQRNKIVDGSRQPPERNEIYEIKPDSVWGVAAGLEKIAGIVANFTELGLYDYKLGFWYPTPPGAKNTATKRVPFIQLPYIAESFRYRLRRMERSMRALGATLQIKDVGLEVERRYPGGVLYYKVCVKMTLNFNGEDRVARRVVRRLYEGLTATLKAEARLRELEVADSYRVMDKQGRPVPQPQPDPDSQRFLRALDTEEQFLVDKITLVPELEGSVQSLGQALFSRLRGLPGERYAVCCDETYLENEIKLPARIRYSRVLAPLVLRPPITVQKNLALAGGINQPLSYVLAAIYTVDRIAGDPTELFHIPENFRKAQRWLERNPAQSLIIGAVVVYGTALVVAGTLATGGALFAAPAAATSAGLVGPTGLAVEGSASELGYGLARSLARETLKNATLPVLEEALPIGERIGQQFTREAAQRVAQQEIDLVLSRELRAAAQSQLQDVVAKRAAAEVKKEVTTTAIAAGGATLAAVALRFAAEGAPANTPGAVPTGPMATVAAEVGSLHLLKLYDDADINKLPQLYAKADYSRFSPEQPGGPRLTPNPPPPQQYFHLGVIKCL